ncbi:MAG: aminomethyl-transferring glycine dehydrogenase subunit GcvPB [bacterium]|nr:aminomethyl-transferring glycine dehydrogenase subunit GcvPB [candidate division KSB1 bacterium]MDH7561468.1 aminomethyl-transferring glycine dehydrogenase subunit GcvPB [bacterium]
MPVPLIFEQSREGQMGVSLPALDVPEKALPDLVPAQFIRKRAPQLPELSEVEVVRHFVALSVMNYHVDKGFYPLGSCTMKYNPKVNENVARLAGFVDVHPLQPAASVQGALRLMHELAGYLCEIGGFQGVTLQPSAGAHGELTGLMVIRAYHERQGNPRATVVIPDSAHGTNPASVTISGYRPVQVCSGLDGRVDLQSLRAVLDENTAALMLTNPNTLGLFESQVEEMARMVHDVGGLMYMDGANLNALLGIVRPGDMGIDVMHFNLHKTFSTPHGGGGPGAGPVGVKEFLLPFLPRPWVGVREGRYYLEEDCPESIGRVHAFYGNFGVMVKAYTYIRMLGAAGLRRVSQGAVINANYLLAKLREAYELPYPGPAMHEFVLSGDRQKAKGVKTLDIAKRLLDLGFHAPTVYFPLIVHEALMIEPTETESKQTLDAFAQAMLQIAQEAEQNPDLPRRAPQRTPVSRLDEARAARMGNICYRPGAA